MLLLIRFFLYEWSAKTLYTLFIKTILYKLVFFISLFSKIGKIVECYMLTDYRYLNTVIKKSWSCLIDCYHGVIFKTSARNKNLFLVGCHFETEILASILTCNIKELQFNFFPTYGWPICWINYATNFALRLFSCSNCL